MRVHTGEFKFTCDTCGKGYQSKKRMLNCQKKHAGIFNFHCDQCDYKTNIHEALERHVMTHSSERNFICPLCQKRSTSHYSLNSHTYKVHKMTLIQIELMTKTNRFGQPMSEEEIQDKTAKRQGLEKGVHAIKNLL